MGNEVYPPFDFDELHNSLYLELTVNQDYASTVHAQKATLNHYRRLGKPRARLY
jgi:hypothetical protein